MIRSLMDRLRACIAFIRGVFQRTPVRTVVSVYVNDREVFGKEAEEALRHLKKMEQEMDAAFKSFGVKRRRW